MNQKEKSIRFNNPRPRVGTAKPGRASSATGRRPSARLVRRRKANAKKGYFPNPRQLNHLGEREFYTYAAWKRAVKQINPNAEFYGDKDIGGAKGIGEWEGDKGWISADLKPAALHSAQAAAYGKNPVKRVKKLPYEVQEQRGNVWQFVAAKATKAGAIAHAKDHARFTSRPVRVFKK